MAYKIVKKFRKTVLVDESGKTVATAPQIRPLGSKFDKPIYVMTDREGQLSVFDAEKNAYVLTGASAAEGSPIIDGVPMIFSKGKNTLYVSPKNASVFRVPENDTLCIALSNQGQPSHDTVFQVHEGKPYPLHKPNMRISNPTSIIRYPQGDSIENVYRPLLISSFDSARYYLQQTKPTDIRILAQSYSLVEGKEKLPEFMRSVLDHLRSEVSQGGAYSVDRLGELIGVADQEEVDLEKRKELLQTQAHEKQIQIDKVNEELAALGYPVALEGRVRYMSGSDKKRAEKTLAKALDNPSEEIAALLAERETLNREIFNIHFDKIQPIEESIYAGPSSIEDYKYSLQTRIDSHLAIDSLEGTFETVLQEYGMTLPQANQDEVQAPTTELPQANTCEQEPTKNADQDQGPTPPIQ